MLVHRLAIIIFLPWHACLSSSGGEILSQIENVEMKENAKFSMHEGRGNKLVFRIFYGNNFLLHLSPPGAGSEEATPPGARPDLPSRTEKEFDFCLSVTLTESQ